MKTKQTILNVIVILAATSLISAKPLPLRGSAIFHQYTDPHLGPMPIPSEESAVQNPYRRFTLEDADCVAEDLDGREPSEMCKARRASSTAVQPNAKRTTRIQGGSERYHEDIDPMNSINPYPHPRNAQEQACAQEAMSGQAPSPKCQQLLTAPEREAVQSVNHFNQLMERIPTEIAARTRPDQKPLFIKYVTDTTLRLWRQAVDLTKLESTNPHGLALIVPQFPPTPGHPVLPPAILVASENELARFTSVIPTTVVRSGPAAYEEGTEALRQYILRVAETLKQDRR